MSKRKKKPSAAENLIESLMDDVREIQADSSIHKDEKDVVFSEGKAESQNNSGNLWDSLEKDFGGDIDSSEFMGSEYSSSADGDDYSHSNSGSESSSDDVEMPDGFAGLPPSERFNVRPRVEEEDEAYDGPSLQGQYQSLDEVSGDDDFYAGASDDEATRPVYSPPPTASSSNTEDKTVSIQQDLNLSMATSTGATSATNATNATSGGDGDKTVAVEGFANARLGSRKNHDVDVKISVGNFRGSSRTGGANVLTSVDASLAQAENLKIAQQRILELEKEVEVLRAENEELASAGEIIRTRTDEFGVRITALEREKSEVQESFQSEILILKGNLQYKENEVAKARVKVDELETRLKSDFKKIRVRERELENRLELLRAEKAALVRSKDEYILDQKRKIDQLSQELDNYRKKCLELNKTIEGNQDQFKRTERALRLALSNLEVKEESLVPLKKAE